MAIRPVRPDELHALVDLCAEHAAYERAPFVRDGQAERLADALFGDRPRLYVWVAEVWVAEGRVAEGAVEPDGRAHCDDGSELLGFAAVAVEFSTWRARPFAHLDCLYLRSSARGQGLGSTLLETAAEHVRGLGCDEMQWQTPPWNRRAIAFYESKGARSAAKVRFGWAL